MSNRTQYDYQQLVDRATQNLSEKEGWGDAYDSSMGQTLIQLLADTTDILHYMQERRVRERYIDTATLRSSIRALGSERGYRPRRNVSSAGNLHIRLVDDDGFSVVPEGNIFIPRYTEFFFDDFTFVNVEDIFITPEQPNVDFEVIQGIPRIDRYDPNGDGFFGESGYILLNDYQRVEENSIVITDDEDEEWLDIRQSYDGKPALGSLSVAAATSKFYDIKISVDGMRIIFGNNTFGSAPASELTMEWVESDGDSLNIEATGIEFNLEQNELQDDINVTPANTYQYEILNTTPIRGGLAAERIEDIQIKAPEYFKTGDRSVTRSDYDFWLIRAGIGGVIDVNTYGEQELGITVYDMNHLFVSYLTTGGENLTVEEEQRFREYLDSYKVAIPHVTLNPADQIFYQYNLVIARGNQLRVSDPEVYEYVRDQIAARFAFKEGSINKPYYFSDLVRFLQDLTITRDGLQQDVARYISLDVNPVFPFETPFEANAVDVEVSVGADGDVYALTVDDGVVEVPVEYSYTQLTGDTETEIINGLVTAIGTDWDTEVVGNTLTLKAGNEQSFWVTNENSTVPDNAMIKQEIQIPPRLLNNRFDEDLIVRNSLSVVNEAGDVLLNDDGVGNIGSNGSVDYLSAKVVIPLQPTGQYFIRYQEDEFKNVKPNERSVVTVLEPKEKIDDVVETLSTIQFIN